MDYWLLVALLCSIFGPVSSKGSDKYKVSVSVHYETLNPESRKFITKDLSLLVKEMPMYINLELIPFGRTEAVPNPDSSYNFTCPQGPDECLGNKIHACAIHHVPELDRLMYFIKCTLLNNTVEIEAHKCAALGNIQFSILDECATFGEGDELLHNLGSLVTHNEVNFNVIPYVTVNRKFVDVSKEKLISVVCEQISMDKPVICMSSNKW